jgi:predicted anti-sigma-YlaC factor YlaD
MKCKKIKNNLLLYIDNKLSDSKTNEIETHLKQCEQCNAEFQKVKSIYKHLGEKAIITENPFFYTRLHQRMENNLVKSQSVKKQILAIVQPITYVFLLGVGIYIGVLIGSGGMLNNNISASETQNPEYMQEYSSSLYIDDMKLETIETTFITESKEK